MTMPIAKSKIREQTLKGIGVSDGVISGPAFFLHNQPVSVPERELVTMEDVENEKKRFFRSLEITRDQLRHQVGEATTKYGKEYGAILESHFLILEDEEMIRATVKRVQSQMINAEAAFSSVMEKFRTTFLKSKNEYLRERAVDIEDVQRRVLRNLLGHGGTTRMPKPAIVVADTIKPSDLIGLDRSLILGFVTEGGSSLAHIAIVARSLNIPAVVGLVGATRALEEDETILIDGHTGEVVVHPEAATVARHQKKWDEARREQEELRRVVGLPSTTLDGHTITLLANVELPDEVEHALSLGADGIGLYRTEYMLFGGRELPSEDQQVEAYRRIAEKNHPHKITMRTFDVGGDKIPVEILSQYGYVHEDNPFMGWRAIRIALQCPTFFRPQIRAILRISAEFNVEIMLPMIISPDEVIEARRQIEDCKNELRQEGLAFNPNIRVGIMIETPAAAMMAVELAKHSDFFSIGTNDLVQYTLAADRGNPKVVSLYNCFHPAVLQLISRTINSAKQHHIPAAMCGEMASNPYATILLIGFGLDEFSVLPPVLPKIRKIVRGTSHDDARRFAEEILSVSDVREIEWRVKEKTKEALGKS
jgi:phosphotransferase system enzyme I (PtsI)